MSKVKLTKRVIDGATPRASRYTVFDSEIRGFGLRVFPSGQKSYVFEYKSGEGGRQAVTKRVTIGKSSEFTPDEARKIADQLRSRAKVGKTHRRRGPIIERRRLLPRLAEQFLRGHVEAKRKPATKSFYEGILQACRYSGLGNRRRQAI